LVELHTIPVQNVPDIQFYSGVDYAPIKLDTNSLAHNAAKICCITVDFPRIIHRVYEDGVRIFIEVGAGNNCSRWISETLKQQEHIAMSINTKGVDDHTGVVRVLAKLVSHGVSVDLSPLYSQPPQKSIQRQSIVKKVTLGGSRIYSKILTAENCEIFQKEIANTGNKSKVMTIAKDPQQTTNHQEQTMKIFQLQIAVAEQL
jgi:acyl transferase domain-containing protein